MAGGHRHRQIALRQPFGRDLPGDVIVGAVAGGGKHTSLTRVDGVAGLLVADPGGVDDRLGAGLGQVMHEHTFGGDGPADVAGTHENDGCQTHAVLLGRGVRGTDHDTVGP